MGEGPGCDTGALHFCLLLQSFSLLSFQPQQYLLTLILKLK